MYSTPSTDIENATSVPEEQDNDLVNEENLRNVLGRCELRMGVQRIGEWCLGDCSLARLIGRRRTGDDIGMVVSIILLAQKLALGVEGRVVRY